jgi:hypothetical protein
MRAVKTLARSEKVRRILRRIVASAIFCSLASGTGGAYTLDYVVPASGGCPQPYQQNFAPGVSLARQWSTSLPTNNVILTLAGSGEDELNEIEATILQAYGSWTGVTGTMINAMTNPNAFAAITRTSTQDACTDDLGDNTDGVNTICFNQTSEAFTTGVLSFTRVIAADAPGVTVGASGPSQFAGQILDADILFCPNGQAQFATPGALATQQGMAAYDMESLLIHELGHLLGMDHSGVWRAAMFPYAPPPGTFLGDRPSSAEPSGPLADDDRVGLRTLYFDITDTVDVGSISGHALPANPFALALLPAPSPGEPVTGIFGAQVVAVNSDTGAVAAAAMAGWSCSDVNPVAVFDGSYTIPHLAIGNSYQVYAEPLDGAFLPGNITNWQAGLCGAGGGAGCTAPQVYTNFAPRFLPSD